MIRQEATGGFNIALFVSVVAWDVSQDMKNIF